MVCRRRSLGTIRRSGLRLASAGRSSPYEEGRKTRKDFLRWWRWPADGAGDSGSAVALFVPRIGVVVVAADFPEAGTVGAGQLDPAHPFRRLPQIKPRD